MATPDFAMTRSRKPVHAPADYSGMDPCVIIHDKGSWHHNTYSGSGFLIDDLIQGVWWYSNAIKCGHCRSSDTLCIYLKNDVAQFDCEVTVELVCRKCGKYTQYSGSD